MATKEVTLLLPNGELPKGMENFTPKQMILAINIGHRIVTEVEESILKMSEEEKTIRRLEIELSVEKELSKRKDEKIINLYKINLEMHEKQISELNERLAIYKNKKR
jgi:hypothetical protein